MIYTSNTTFAFDLDTGRFELGYEPLYRALDIFPVRQGLGGVVLMLRLTFSDLCTIGGNILVDIPDSASIS
jgi:hypothetical protein